MKNRILRRFADRVAQLYFGGLEVSLRDILFGLLDRGRGFFGVGGGTRNMATAVAKTTKRHGKRL